LKSFLQNGTKRVFGKFSKILMFVVWNSTSIKSPTDCMDILLCPERHGILMELYENVLVTNTHLSMKLSDVPWDVTTGHVNEGLKMRLEQPNDFEIK
jgi:hypothetical protein